MNHEHMRYIAPEEIAIEGAGTCCLWDERFYEPPRPVTHTREQVNEIKAQLARAGAHILASNARCVADWLQRGMLADGRTGGER